MASVFTFQPLLVVFITVTSSFFAMSNSWCSQYDSSSCNSDQVCCNNECVLGSDCLHQYCSVDSDCGFHETCCGRRCRFDCRCTQGSCDSGQVCCNNDCVIGSDCLGQFCYGHSDCAIAESCCGSRCTSDCLGFSCSTDSDCGSSENCCDGTCSFRSCYDYTPVIVGAVFGALFFACLISMCFYYACRKRRVNNGKVFVGQRVTTTTVRTTRGVPQPNPPYPGQVPPLYQQGYQYYPPPQYEHHHTAIPPPYNPGTTAANDRPPSNSAATQDRSGRVYTPKTSYGAIQTPSVPPPVQRHHSALV